MSTITELMVRRRSVRTYTPEPLSEADLTPLRHLLQEINTAGPFHNVIRFELLLLDAAEIAQLHRLIHYGFVTGAPAFVAGIMPLQERSLEDFGYLMETLILRLGALPLDGRQPG